MIVFDKANKIMFSARKESELVVGAIVPVGQSWVNQEPPTACHLLIILSPPQTASLWNKLSTTMTLWGTLEPHSNQNIIG